MAIVTCPECSKKLKVADASLGKKVKFSCGNIFVAAPVEAVAAVSGPGTAAPTKVNVACSACGAMLKVATTSLGKKMKCPKCAAVFVATSEMEAAKAKKEADEMDDLMAFAEDDAERETIVKGAKDEPIKTKGKPEPVLEEDEVQDEQEDRPARRPARKSSRTGAAVAKPVYPSRLLPNLLVTLVVFGYIGVFGLVFFAADVFDPAKLLHLPESQGPLPKNFPKAKFVDREVKNNKVPEGKDSDKAGEKKGIGNAKGTDAGQEKIAKPKPQPKPALNPDQKLEQSFVKLGGR